MTDEERKIVNPRRLPPEPSQGQQPPTEVALDQATREWMAAMMKLIADTVTAPERTHIEIRKAELAVERENADRSYRLNLIVLLPTIAGIALLFAFDRTDEAMTLIGILGAGVFGFGASESRRRKRG